jgi:hypothetical protein
MSAAEVSALAPVFEAGQYPAVEVPCCRSVECVADPRLTIGNLGHLLEYFGLLLRSHVVLMRLT